MFDRTVLDKLRQWATTEKHKPLIIRGARQVGKTTIIKHFGQQFHHFISLNLEKSSDRKIFEQKLPIDKLLQAIFFQHNIERQPNATILIFIDEIQQSPDAVAILRYFYEESPDIHIIAAGSLLETLIDTHVSFPVGRVEYLYMYPLSFYEFLNAIGEKSAALMLTQQDIPHFAHDKLLELFHLYTMLGGMPEVIESYAQYRDLVRLTPIYEGLLFSYEDDVEKYAKDSSQANIIRHVIHSAPFQAGERIKFQHFGHSNYGSREIGEAMRILEKALLIKLIYPTTACSPPYESNHKKSPRLQFLDTGLLNHVVGLHKEYFALTDLNQLYRGKITEHIVGQQILASNLLGMNQLLFWVREKSQSSAEIDFLVPQGTTCIPIEVKSGKTGTLRSLHTFLEHQAQTTVAIRLYAGFISIEKATTVNGKEYRLINLPYYLSGQLSEWVMKVF